MQNIAACTISNMIRLATGDDAAGVQAIYAPIVRDTVISFEIDPPTIAEMRDRIEKILPDWPWLVWESDGNILGYVYASQHHPRAAYQWSVDVTVYVHPDHHRRGIGQSLYTALFARLKTQGYFNAYAGITLPNTASVGIHQAMGFEPVGIYRSVGYKFGQWHDVGWYAFQLQESYRQPAPPLPTLPEVS